MADIDLDAARALATHARIDIAARERLPDLIEQLCDVLEQCGYNLVGEWAAKLAISDPYDEGLGLIHPMSYKQMACHAVREGRRLDPRWRLLHRTVGPWVEVNDDA